MGSITERNTTTCFPRAGHQRTYVNIAVSKPAARRVGEMQGQQTPASRRDGRERVDLLDLHMERVRDHANALHVAVIRELQRLVDAVDQVCS